MQFLAAWKQNTLYLPLADAPFDREDPTLNPAARACIICPRRSGYNIALFEEVGVPFRSVLAPTAQISFQTSKKRPRKRTMQGQSGRGPLQSQAAISRPSSLPCRVLIQGLSPTSVLQSGQTTEFHPPSLLDALHSSQYNLTLLLLAVVFVV
jgi:hypothetical protein